MYLKKIILATLFSYLICFSLNAQLRFNAIELGKTINSGTALSAADINGDHLPDLINIHNSLEVWIGLNTGTLQFLWQKLDDADGFVWSVNVADLDNNSYNDIIISGELFGVLVYYQDATGFTKAFLDSSGFFSQAAALLDVNRDGLLDFTICDENAKTRFYKNTGNQSFQLDTQIINLRINEKDSEAGNYGCIWSDIDGDHDPDLYISRCRPDVKDSTDRRRRNLFYHNDQGNFKEEGEFRNIGILDQSWVSDIGDLDGDGLQDLVIINHYSPCNVFRQTVDHHFENVTIQTGFDYKGTGLQLSLQDFDNDMDLDILIAGDVCELWLNDGKMNFTKFQNVFSNHTISTFCVADFNQDGMLDISASFADLVNAPNIVRDRVLISEKNANHFVGFMLQGQQANRNGIGAQLQIYTKGIRQFRELRCGESFGIQNSHQVHFGLGPNEIIDSLIVLWPGGIENRFYNIPSNDYYLITETNCINKRIEIYPDNQKVLCDTETLNVKAQPGLTNILWNTGERTNDLRIDKNGMYFYQAYDSINCPVVSNSLYVEYDPVESPKLNLSGLQIICSDEELELYVENYNEVIWNDFSTNSIRYINKPGIYYAIVKGACDNFLTDTLIVETNQALSTPVIRDTTILLPASVTLESDKDNTHWFNNETDPNPVFTGKIYTTPIIPNTTQVWAESFANYPYPVVCGGMPAPKYHFSPFHTHTLNGGLFFTVHQDCILESVVVHTDRVGTRRILLQDENLNTLDSIEFEVNPGMNLLQLNFNLFASQTKYYLTTSTSVNKAGFLSNSPWLYRSEIEFSFPIRIQDIITILHSASGESEYQYFYDWKIKLVDKECSSNRIPVNIIVKGTSTADVRPSLWDYILYQNRNIHIKDKSTLDDLVITDSKGAEIIHVEQPESNTITLDHIPAGMYFVRFKLKNSNSIFQGRIFIE